MNPMIRRWGPMSPQFGRANIDWESFTEEQMKAYFPKEWAKRFGGLERGKVYTFNALKGHEHHFLEPGERVKLLPICPELHTHVEVETVDPNRQYVGLVHIICLMLDRA